MGRALFAAHVTDLSIPAQQYVTDLYEAFLQRAPDGPGLSFWLSKVQNEGRASALSGFQNSTEFGELAGTLYREAFWLVTDHLGTPRMVADRSGSLAGVRRHDYLPFGDEVGAGVGGRTPQQGYNAGDNVRQKYTGYERDSETGLNYALNRYHSPIQGRFISPDPLSGEKTNPQTWNRYSYVLNNPLTFVDPEGLRYVQRTLANGDIEYGWCATEGCYNQAVDKNAKDYAGWTTVTFDESQPFEFVTYGTGGNRYDAYRLNPDGTHGYARIFDGGSAGVTPDFATQFALTGLFQGIASGVRAGLSALFSRAATTAATELSGLYGPVSAEALASIESAAGSNATVQVFTKLTRPPALGRSLHVAVDEAGAATARGAGQVYTARIPQPLLDQLVRSGLATKDQLVWEGGKQVTTQYHILPQASKFVVDYFK